MVLTEEIRKWFSNSHVNQAYEIQAVDPEYPAYVLRFDDSFGVAIPYDGEKICEYFASASICSDELIINGERISCLMLTSNIENSRNEFAVVCSSFVEPGNNGELRLDLVREPLQWWKRWKILIGNTNIDKKTYAVLAEMLMYDYLLKQGKHVIWAGAEAASHDLISKECDYEVKSTVSRYEKLIHVTGQFQMCKDRMLKLFFCRLEKNATGICIDDMVKKLVNIGQQEDAINEKLRKVGYDIGRGARKEKYIVHEVLEYIVDDNFPCITPSKFIGGTIPAGIKRVSYEVDLTALESNKISL